MRNYKITRQIVSNSSLLSGSIFRREFSVTSSPFASKCLRDPGVYRHFHFTFNGLVGSFIGGLLYYWSQNDKKIPILAEASTNENAIAVFNIEAVHNEEISMKEALQKCCSVLNKGKYRQEEYELFTRLVGLYKRQANTADKLDNYPKAIGICHYVLKLLDEENDITSKEEKREFILKSINDIEAGFFQELKKTSPGTLGINRIEKHKKSLAECRRGIRKYLDELTDLGLPVGSEEIDEVGIRERAKKVEEIYLSIRNFFIGEGGKGGLFNELFLECVNDLGGLPKVGDRDVQYALYGLGSMALGTMTPWSDVEFGILIEEGLGEEKNEEVKQFFREVTTLLYMRVTNFGETLIKALGIEELNNLKSSKRENSWFYDELTKSGFSFDGVVREACKIPLGRKGYLNEKDEPIPDFELITTPSELAAFQGDARFAQDEYLLQALNHVTMINGNIQLLEQYNKENKDKASELFKYKQGALRILRQDLLKYHINEEDTTLDGKVLNVKKELYRFPDRIIVALADYYCLNSKDNYHTIELLCDRGIINEKARDNLRIALSITNELRLRAYGFQGGQYDDLTLLENFSTEINQQQATTSQALKKALYLQDNRIVKRYYYVLFPLQEAVKAMASEEKFVERIDSALLDDSAWRKGIVCRLLFEYASAKTHIENAIEKDQGNMNLFLELGLILLGLGKYNEAEETIFNAFKICRSKIDADPGLFFTYLYIADRLGIIKATLQHGDCESYYGQIIDEVEKYLINLLPGEYVNTIDENYKKILITLENAVSLFRRLPLDEINYNKKIEIQHGKKAVFLQVVSLLSNIYEGYGVVLEGEGKLDDSLLMHKRALEIREVLCGDNPESAIANSKMNIANVLDYQGNFEEALAEYREALSILERFYGGTAHPRIAELLLNTGLVLSNLNRHEEAIKNYGDALNIYLLRYSECSLNIASLYDNWALSLRKLNGPKEIVLALHESALNIRKKSLPKSHTHLARSYYNVGIAYLNYEEYDKALISLQEAIDATPSESKETNLEFSDIYHEMGNTCYQLKKYDDAFKYYITAYVLRDIWSTNNTVNKVLKKKLDDSHRRINQVLEDLPQAQGGINRLWYLERALPNMRGNREEKGEAYWLYSIGSSLVKLNFIEAALLRLNEAIKVASEHNNYYVVAISYNMMGVLSLKIDQLEDAIEAFQLSLRNMIMCGDEYVQHLSLIRLNIINVSIAIYEQKVINDETNRSYKHNLARYYHVKSMQLKQKAGEGKSIDSESAAYIAKAKAMFIKAITLDSEEAVKSSLYAEYSMFLFNHHKAENEKEFQERANYLRKAIGLNGDGSGLAYSRIEKTTIIEPLQVLLREQEEIGVKPYALAYYLLIKLYKMHGQEVEARQVLEEFAKAASVDKDKVTQHLLAAAQQELSSVEIAAPTSWVQRVTEDSLGEGKGIEK